MIPMGGDSSVLPIICLSRAASPRRSSSVRDPPISHGATVGLDQKSAGVQRSIRSAKCNLGPMARKYEMYLAARAHAVHANVFARDRKSLGDMGIREADVQRPAEEQHLEPRKRQYRPEALQGHQAGNPERGPAHDPKEEECGPRSERAVGPQLQANIVRSRVHQALTGFKARVAYSRPNPVATQRVSAAALLEPTHRSP